MGNELRLSMTGKDLVAMDAEVNRYLMQYFPHISAFMEGTPGRNFVRLLEGIVDTLNFQLDVSYIESRMATAQQTRNAAYIAESYLYEYQGYQPARATLTFTNLGGPAPAGGRPIPIYTRVARAVNPSYEFLVTSPGVIPEGQTTVEVPAAEGIRVVQEEVTVLQQAVGDGGWVWVGYIRNPKVWLDSLSLRVGGQLWSRLKLWEASPGPNYQGYRAFVDPESQITMVLGYSRGILQTLVPPSGQSIKVDYIFSHGADGNTIAGKITKIAGPLNSTCSCINQDNAAGGTNGESADELRSLGPHALDSARAVITDTDIENTATQVGGVYRAKIARVSGYEIDIYVLPYGGIIAPQALLDAVKVKLMELSLFNTAIKASSVVDCYTRMTLNVVMVDMTLSKESVAAAVRSAIRDLSYWENVKIGRTLATSDIDSAVKNIYENPLIDFVDITKLTRIPRVDKSDDTTPDVYGEVEVNLATDYATYVITTLDATHFNVSKNGSIYSATGTIGTPYTTAGGEITFQIGMSGDTFPAPFGQYYTIYTSAYKGNVKVLADEVVAFQLDSDIDVAVYYPGEYAATN